MANKKENGPSRSPKHLQDATKQWFDSVCAEFDLEEHHIRILTLASEAWDRGVLAREAIQKHGMTFEDRFGCPRSRPEIAIERDSRVSFARLCRELDLDAGQPAATRPPALHSNRRT